MKHKYNKPQSSNITSAHQSIMSCLTAVTLCSKIVNNATPMADPNSSLEPTPLLPVKLHLSNLK